jgi:hypothetical protein
MSKILQDTWILTLSALNNSEVTGGYFTLDKDALSGPAVLAPDGVV